MEYFSIFLITHLRDTNILFSDSTNDTISYNKFIVSLIIFATIFIITLHVIFVKLNVSQEKFENICITEEILIILYQRYKSIDFKKLY